MSSLISLLNPLDILLGALILSWSDPLFLSLNKSYETWKTNPYVNTSLVFLEKTNDVFLPLTNTILTPTIKAVVLLYNTLKPIILAILNVTRATLQKIRDMGVSLSLVAQNVASTVLDFGKSLATVTKAVVQGTAYILKGFSIVIASFENLFTLGYRILFHTRELTWDDATSALIPLVVVGSTLGFFYWMKKPSATASAATATAAAAETNSVLRRSPRIARKRSMFLCQDLSSFPLAGKKSATATTNL